MKLFYTTIFIFFSLLIFAQDFAPVGAKWYYCEGFAFKGDVDYIQFTVEKDTLFKNQLCRKIIKRHDINCYGRPSVEFLYSQNDTVFIYDEKLDTFQILYNFRATKGDSWNIKYKEHNNSIVNVKVKVDSISTIQYNNQNLKVFYTTDSLYCPSCPFRVQSNKIIEKLGNVIYMFNNVDQWLFGACDGNYSGGLRCYEDSTIGKIHLITWQDCTYSNVAINSTSESEILLFPNPTSNFIYIKESQPNSSYEIFNLWGEKVKSGSIENTFISIENLPKGLYLLRVKDKNQNEVFREKVEKN